MVSFCVHFLEKSIAKVAEGSGNDKTTLFLFTSGLAFGVDLGVSLRVDPFGVDVTPDAFGVPVTPSGTSRPFDDASSEAGSGGGITGNGACSSKNTMKNISSRSQVDFLIGPIVSREIASPDWEAYKECVLPNVT